MASIPNMAGFYQGDHTAYVMALAKAVKPEFEAIAATGIKLQAGSYAYLTRRPHFLHLRSA